MSTVFNQSAIVDKSLPSGERIRILTGRCSHIENSL